MYCYMNMVQINLWTYFTSSNKQIEVQRSYYIGKYGYMCVI